MLDIKDHFSTLPTTESNPNNQFVSLGSRKYIKKGLRALHFYHLSVSREVKGVGSGSINQLRRRKLNGELDKSLFLENQA